MIDVTSYTDKLELLREWINGRIDGIISPPIWVNMEALSFKYTIEEVIRIYNQTGLILYRAKDVVENPAIPLSFEEYYKYKKEINNQ